MTVTIEKTFQIPVWDEFVKFRTIDFWTRHRIKFTETLGNKLIGTRGSLFGNLISFDMSRLTSKLSISVSPQNTVCCLLEVNTFMQKITEYDRAWWDLEMEIFKTFLLKADEQEARWKKFNTNHKKATLKWNFSLGTCGNKITLQDCNNNK
jgi:hypothetical protein